MLTEKLCPTCGAETHYDTDLGLEKCNECEWSSPFIDSDEYSPYCELCGGCGEDGCCSHLSCFRTLICCCFSAIFC